MNKNELIDTFALMADLNSQDQAETMVDVFCKIIHNTLLSGEDVTLPGIGDLKIYVGIRSAVVSFSPTQSFKDAIATIQQGK